MNIIIFCLFLLHYPFIIFLHRTLLLQYVSLKHQNILLKRTVKKPMIRWYDKIFWVMFSRLYNNWKSELIIVKPDTVVKWHRKLYSIFWRIKSKPGRPIIPREHISYIKRISSDHPEYGADRIAGELELKFGIQHSPSTVQKYLYRPLKPHVSSNTWKTFLKNQGKFIYSCDFLTTPTLSFKNIYIFVVMEIESRKIVGINVTEHPTLEWTKQQIRNITEFNAPKFIIHDNAGMFGQFKKTEIAGDFISKNPYRCSFDLWLKEVMNIRGIPIPYGAPNANAHCERLIGTIRRECLDHVIVFNENHLKSVLNEYVEWYNHARFHQGLCSIPEPYPEICTKKPANGKLKAIPVLNGLHHDYRLVA